MELDSSQLYDTSVPWDDLLICKQILQIHPKPVCLKNTSKFEILY